MMVRKIVTITMLTLLTVVASSTLFAQNLLDNAEMRQAREYERQAEQAIEEGAYEEAIEYAEQAAEYAERGRETAQQLALGYRADTLRNRADSRLYYARRIGVPSQDEETYDEAVEVFEQGAQQLEDEEYQDSIDSFQEVLDLLEGFQPRRFVAERPEAFEPAAENPQYYIVRLIPERRDSFWRIAEYDFVYGDPWLWPRLYERNKDLLQDPENPDLIQPGMMFEIPRREGEERAGVWNPDDAIEE
ncbi:MAG: hypothetical protein ACOC0D_00645 [Spirochaeta sp.]